MKLISTAALGLCMLAAPVMAQPAPQPMPMGKPQQQQQPHVFKDGGLKDAALEQMLPRGGVVHLRINNVKEVIFTLEKFLVNSVPDKALPPPVRLLLKHPHPLLAAAAMELGIQELDIATIGKMVGLDLNEPLSITFYPGNPEQSYLISLPVADAAALSRLLTGEIRPRKIEEQRYGLYTGSKIKPRNRDWGREVHVVSSPKRIFISGTAMWLAMLGPQPGGGLNADPAVAKSLASYGKNDVFVSISPDFIKGQLAQWNQMFGAYPQGKVNELRAMANEGMSPEDRMKLNMRLRTRMGIKDIEEGFDYLEAFGKPTYELLFKSIMEQAQSLEGFAAGIDLGDKTQKVAFSVFSQKIKAANCTQPIPMADVSAAIDQLPGERSWISVSGRVPKAKDCSFVKNWVEGVKSNLKAKSLDSEPFDALAAYLLTSVKVDSLESRVPWTMKTCVNKGQPFSLKKYNSVAELWEDMENPAKFLGNAHLKFMPSDNPEVFSKYLQDKRASLEKEYKVGRDYAKKLKQTNPFFDKAVRYKAGSEFGLTSWTLEEAYTSRSGFFGYHQHELINREIYYGKIMGKLLAVEEHSFGKPLLAQSPKAKAASAAVKRLMAMAPKDANKICVAESKHPLLQLAQGIVDLESLIHRDLDQYLAKVNAISAKLDGQAELDAIMELDMPLVLSSLNYSAEAKKYYGVIFGQFVYPRPKATGVLGYLFKDYAPQDRSLGGGAVFERTVDGQYECQLVQNTDALSLMVRTTVNNYFARFVEDPQGLPKFMQGIMAKDDGRPGMAREVVVENLLWEFLNDLNAEPQVEIEEFPGFDD